MRALLFALLLLPAAALGEEPFRRSVTVYGEGKVEATPDRAILPVTIETKEKALADAKAKNDKRTDALIKTATSFGISRDKLKTSGLMIAPQYRWEQKTNRQVFEGYMVSRSVTITVDDLEKSEKLIAALTEAGIDQVQGIQFTFANPEALEASARKLAMGDARAKAQQLAEAGGAKLGTPLTIALTEGGHAPPQPMMMRAAMADAKAEAAPPPLPGTSIIQQQVTVVYELQ